MSRSRDPLSVIVLAAGMGTRMRSKRAKLLHPVAGRPMATYVAAAAAALKPRSIIAVIGHQADDVREILAEHCTDFAVQREQRGTGHAVMQAVTRLRPRSRGTVLIVNGDLPTLRPATLRALLARHRKSGAAMTLLTAELADPTGYGRIVRGADGEIVRIVEHRDADASIRAIREVNVGIYCAEVAALLPILETLRPDNVQGEYYLTDAVHRLIEGGRRVRAVVHDDVEEVLGVNTRAELARATRTLYDRKASELMAKGVTLLDPARTWVDPRARIGRDSVLYPDVIIEGACVLGEDCVVRPGCRIANSRLGRGVEVKDHSVVADSAVGNEVQIGPFAHLRPGSRLDVDVRVGNFVEVKKSHLRRGVKASHLSYLGDADIGADSNIGAGTITCNYDGRRKLPTVLGKGVFIGSDSQLIAPVRIGDGAYVGAGTTVTEDVPPKALALSRTRQHNVEGWVDRQSAREAGRSGGRRGRKRGSE